MKAIILAAGHATRLYPLTENFPKPLLPISCDKPIINYILERIEELEAISVIYVITTKKFYNLFLQWKEQYKNIFKKNIEIVHNNTILEEEKLGAIGDIYYTIKEKSIEEDTLIIAGDNFFDFSLKKVYNFFYENKENKKNIVCTMNIDEIEKLKRMGVATLDDENRITCLTEKPYKPESNTAVFAIYFYTKSTVSLFSKYLDEGNLKDAPGYFLSWLCKREDVFAYNISGNCYDIGTLEGYEEVKSKYKK